MKNLLKTTLFTVMILGGIFPIVVFAEDDAIRQEESFEFARVLGSYVLPDPVGTIQGRDISRQELNGFLSITQGVEVDEVSDAFIVMQILRQRGGQEALSLNAKSRGLDQSEDYKMRMQFVEQQLLIELLMRDMIAKNELDLVSVKAEYQQSFQKQGQYEYRVSQVLVETEEAAQAIIDAINRQETTLAQAARVASELPEDDEYTGSLGDWFERSMVDADFGDAMALLKKGEMSSEPVKTEYGYHVIVLDDVRAIEQPAFETLDAETIYRLASPAFEQYKETVQERVKVELPKTK